MSCVKSEAQCQSWVGAGGSQGPPEQAQVELVELLELEAASPARSILWNILTLQIQIEVRRNKKGQIRSLPQMRRPKEDACQEAFAEKVSASRPESLFKQVQN